MCFVLLDTVENLADRCRKIKDLTVTRGDAHDFSGVTFDFSFKKKLRINLDVYVQEVIDEADVTLK